MLESKAPGPARRNPANPARSGRKQRQRASACAAGSPVLGSNQPLAFSNQPAQHLSDVRD